MVYCCYLYPEVYAMNTLAHRDSLSVRSVLYGVLLLSGAWTLSVYLQLTPTPLIRLLLITAALLAFNQLLRSPLKRREYAIFSIFSAVISLVLVLGYHVHVEDLYHGKITENYITPYTLADALAFLSMLPVLTTLFCALYQFVCSPKIIPTEIPSASNKRRLAIFATLFVCYLPYLLAYWPGLVVGDTMMSLDQIFGYQPYVNHHPVLYTLYIRFCLFIGQTLFHSATAGYALYTVTQMLFVSFALAHIIDWLWRHAHLCLPAGLCICAFFGLSPYFAAFSIVGWKDPVFSASVALVSVFLLDDVLHPVRKKTLRSYFIYEFLLLMIVFFRNNGFTVIGAIALWQIGTLIFSKGKHRAAALHMASITLSSLLIFFFVTGPVYDHTGIQSDPRESNALVLQQLARVGALHGDTTPQQANFLYELLPFSPYEDVYRPCCVDLLKWDEGFNRWILNKTMYKHWLMMFPRNVDIYFDAWVLNTFGFWTLNVPDANAETQNISRGGLKNTSSLPDQLVLKERYGIELSNLLGDHAFRSIFVTDEWFIPSGWMFWSVVFLSLCLFLKGRYDLLTFLVPTFGLTLPILLVTPIAHWLRYTGALHYLLPVYLYLFSQLKSKSE